MLPVNNYFKYKSKIAYKLQYTILQKIKYRSYLTAIITGIAKTSEHEVLCNNSIRVYLTAITQLCWKHPRKEKLKCNFNYLPTIVNDTRY